MKINKRDMIYCWLGMGLLNPGSGGGKAAGERVLAKLVEVGLIDGPIRDNIYSRYRMCASVRSKVQQAMSLKVGEEKCFRKISERTEPEKIEALVNVSGRGLDSETFEGLLSKMKNTKVLHLGSLKNDSTDSIVVEDQEFLKVLKQMVGLKFLSLSGISGIVHLPDSVCKLQNLEISDLRACNNLESVPHGIGALQKLRQLDLSECYSLNYIPTTVASLTNLVVFKGFVMKANPDSAEVCVSKGCGLSDLLALKQLRKLFIRTRRMNFPTREDLEILCEMKLNKLGIAWVGNSSDAQTDSDLERFPATVEKLELHTAPNSAASRLLELISKEGRNFLKKLYIKGGGLKRLDQDKHILVHVQQVRLRYLSKLDVD